MGKVVLNLAMSLDGYIAREDGSVDWLDDLDTDGSDLGFSSFLDSIGSIITGRISFDDTKQLSNGMWPFKDKDTYVITSKKYEPIDRVIFIQSDITELVKHLKKTNAKDIWLFGGGQLIQYFIANNLIDEYIITTIPIMIGSGKKLFQTVHVESKLELVEVVKCKNIVQTHYIVKK